MASASKTAPSAGLIEQYRLAVEMADRVSARRTAANAFFATIHTALLSFFSSSFLPPSSQEAAKPDRGGVLIVVAAGIVMAATWFLLLRSYRDLNNAKFKVIQKMEDSLPATPFKDEWEELKSDPVKPWRARYAEFNTLERLVPAIFAALYVLLAVWAI